LNLYIIRHGETAYNKLGRIQGQSCDSNLTELGIKQAELVGEKIKDIHFDFIYTSDLKRAETTAEIIVNSANLQTKITPSKLLRERNFGDIEGLNAEEIEKKYPLSMSEFRVSTTTPPPNGESLQDMLSRLKKFYSVIKKQHIDDNNILIITHGGAIRMLILAILNLGLEYHKNFSFNNASLTIFHITEKLTKLVVANDTCHLNNLVIPHDKDNALFDKLANDLYKIY